MMSRCLFFDRSLRMVANLEFGILNFLSFIEAATKTEGKLREATAADNPLIKGHPGKCIHAPGPNANNCSCSDLLFRFLVLVAVLVIAVGLSLISPAHPVLALKPPPR
jgi:hypothetical protein